MDASEQNDFASFALAAMPRLRRLAVSLCGDPYQADDLVQIALERVCIVWGRRSISDPFAYARAVLARSAISESRRGWRRKERSSSELPWNVGVEDQSGSVNDRVSLFQALRRLPPRQRHAVVLRYLEDLPISTVAELLGCSEGNVKRVSHDGLSALRLLLADSTERTEST